MILIAHIHFFLILNFYFSFFFLERRLFCKVSFFFRLQLRLIGMFPTFFYGKFPTDNYYGMFIQLTIFRQVSNFFPDDFLRKRLDTFNGLIRQVSNFFPDELLRNFFFLHKDFTGMFSNFFSRRPLRHVFHFFCPTTLLASFQRFSMFPLFFHRHIPTSFNGLSCASQLKWNIWKIIMYKSYIRAAGFAPGRFFWRRFPLVCMQTMKILVLDMPLHLRLQTKQGLLTGTQASLKMKYLGNYISRIGSFLLALD